MARHPTQTTALALSGGNALGAYAAGAYEALHERGYLPDIVAGASIGAINGGIIAGNVPDRRVAQLREFWAQAATGSAFGYAPAEGKPREMYNAAHALQTLMMGRPGLFSPRIPGLLSILPGMPPDVGVFDSKPLVATLTRTIDFQRLNRADVPLLVSAVDMEQGSSVTFDTRKDTLTPAHFLATSAFTPAFPPVEIEGRCLGDPGLISNLPIDALLDPPQRSNLVCFAVDLFDSRGARPRTMDAALERAQDIIFTAQSTRAIDARGREHRLKRIIADLARRVPAKQRAGAISKLASHGCEHDLTVVLIAYRSRPHEVSAKMLEFSRASIEERWAIGKHDMSAAVAMLEAGAATTSEHGYHFYDARRAHG